MHLAEHKKYQKENGVKADPKAENPGRVRGGKSKTGRRAAATAETEPAEAPAPAPKKRGRSAAKPATKVKAKRVK